MGLVMELQGHGFVLASFMLFAGLGPRGGQHFYGFVAGALRVGIFSRGRARALRVGNIFYRVARGALRAGNILRDFIGAQGRRRRSMPVLLRMRLAISSMEHSVVSRVWME